MKQTTVMIIYGVRLPEDIAKKIFENQIKCDLSPNVRLFANKVDTSYQNEYFEPGYEHILGIKYAMNGQGKLDNTIYAIKNTPQSVEKDFIPAREYLQSLGLKVYCEVVMINQYK